jgi:histone-lysine N-methyltransferase SETD1
LSAKKKDKKKKKKKKKKDFSEDSEEGNSGGSDEGRSRRSKDNGGKTDIKKGGMFSHLLNNNTGMVKAVPAFYFFLGENRNRIDRNLSRKHRYFNRLPKANMERNQLIAKEGIMMWNKLSDSEIQRYVQISMKDYEQKIIEWKEEKTLRQMFAAPEEGSSGDELAYGGKNDRNRDLSLEDERLTQENHRRLYLSTTVGFKPYKPDTEESNNRVLLELLQDTRFNPLPMIQADRSAREYGEMDFERITIPYFDINGPVSTCLGDECLGCSRGWAHFCNVLKRRIPAVARRAKLQPPLSSLVATRIGLGLRDPPLAADDEDSDIDNRTKKGSSSKANGGIKKSSDCDVEVFTSRDIPSAAAAKALPLYPWEPLTAPTERADDIVRFVEEAVCMKIPEPPRPGEVHNDGHGQDGSNKKKTPSISSSLLSLNLPTKGRKRSSEDIGNLSNEEDAEITVNKCGRCRTIIESDTGCVPCRRAQLVINKSRGEDQADENSKILRIQTNMLGRIVMRDGEVEAQTDGDESVSNHILRQRWTPFAILPPTTLTSPIPGLDGDSEESSDGDESGDDEDEVEESTADGTDSMDVTSEKNDDVLNTVSDDTMETEEENSGNEETSLVRPSKRLRASSRIEALESNATSSNASSEKIVDTEERSTLIKKFKEEANAFHKKCISIACSGILLGLTRRDPLQHFAQPAEAEGYHDIIHEPMDFGRMKKKVFRNKYATLGAFVSDARLLCDNAMVFNPPDSIYYKTAKELSDVLTVMQKRASEWISAMKDAQAATFNNIFASKPEENASDNDGIDSKDDEQPKETKPSPFLGGDPFTRLREEWPEAVEMFEDTEWLQRSVESDFSRTKENETAYYGVLAIRRAAMAAAASLAPYTDSGGMFNTVGRRTHEEDEKLRNFVSEKVAETVTPPELKDIPSWREEMIMRVLRKSQARRMEGRMGSTHGCARCDGVKVADPDSNKAMNAVTVRWGRTRKKPNEVPRIHKSRLGLSTGLGSQITRDRIQKHKTSDIRKGLRKGKTWALVAAANKVNEVSVTARGSRIHGMGLFGGLLLRDSELFCLFAGTCCVFSIHSVTHRSKCFVSSFPLLTADQPLQKGDVVAEYVGEYVSPAVTDAREKIYQCERIQDYQFRIDSQLVIDATKRGGHGRYANHNCDPNCATKIIPFEMPSKDGKDSSLESAADSEISRKLPGGGKSILKRVVIVALRDIEPMEELSYDYQFPLEVNMDERIPCNCGSEVCRGFMNWDLPEKGARNQVFRTQKRGANMRDRIRRLGRPLKGEK